MDVASYVVCDVQLGEKDNSKHTWQNRIAFEDTLITTSYLFFFKAARVVLLQSQPQPSEHSGRPLRARVQDVL